jgi:hypothetical protein
MTFPHKRKIDHLYSKIFFRFIEKKNLLWNSKHSKKWIWEYCEIKSKPQKIRKYFFFIHRNHWMIQRNFVGKIYSGKLKMFWQTMQMFQFNFVTAVCVPANQSKYISYRRFIRDKPKCKNNFSFAFSKFFNVYTYTKLLIQGKF